MYVYLMKKQDSLIYNQDAMKQLLDEALNSVPEEVH